MCLCVCVRCSFFVACALKCFNYDQMRESRTESQEPENMRANGMDGASPDFIPYGSILCVGRALQNVSIIVAHKSVS